MNEDRKTLLISTAINLLQTRLGKLVRLTLGSLAAVMASRAEFDVDLQESILKIASLAIMLGVEWIVFDWRAHQGRTLQGIINDMAGRDVITEDGIIGAITVSEAARVGGIVASSIPTGERSNTGVASIIIALALLPSLTGCAGLQQWASEHKTQLTATAQVAATVAARAALNFAVDQLDAQAKSNTLKMLAGQLRKNSAEILTAADVRKILNAWAPNDGAVWQELSARVAAIAAEELAAKGDAKAAQIVGAIADGLDQAAGIISVELPQ